MDQKKTVDDLAGHIAIFHSASRTSSSNPNSRKVILRWFYSLSPPQRQACLTVVDADFVKILLQMISRLQNDGLCHFFLLPDLPSSPGSSLPSLCHRQLDGLLYRVSSSNESERLIFRCVRLFGSREGETGKEYDLDSISLCEELVKDAEAFVRVMDVISSGEFLRESDICDLQSAWVELEWLKGKGYYSVESFIANKFELALRSSWMEHNGGRNPRAMKSRSKIAAAGVGANAFWRQKGCLDWWQGLDPRVRKNMCVGFLGKGAIPLVKEIIKKRFSDMKDESAPLWIRSKSNASYFSVSPLKRMSQLCCSLDPNFFFGSGSFAPSRKPCRLANQLNPLVVLQEISESLTRLSNAKCESESMFLSELGSVMDVSDWILRRLRWSLVSVWKECMKIELTSDLKNNTSQAHTEQGFGNAKKKGRNSKKLNSSPKGLKCYGNAKDKEKSKSKTSFTGNLSSARSSTSTQEETIEEGAKLPTEMISVVPNQRNTAKKRSSGRKRSRFKSSMCMELHGTIDPESKVMDIDANISKESHQQISHNNGPLEKEVLKQPTSANSVCCSSVKSPSGYSQNSLEFKTKKLITNSRHEVSPETSIGKDESGKASSFKDVGDEIVGCKRGQFWSDNEFDLKNLKFFSDRASTHSHFDSTAADLLHLDSIHSKKLLYPLSVSHRGLDPSKNKASRHQVTSPRVLPMSFDWPLMVRSLAPLSFDSLCNMRFPSTPCSEIPNTNKQSDTTYSRDVLDFCKFKSALETLDDSEGYWLSEDESDSHTLPGHDYNKLFGGGVMYWNTSDHVTTAFSQAPSQSSEDSLLAWHEADLNRAVDDMVGFVLPGNEVPEEKSAISEVLKGDSHSYPVLRPIIIPNISRKGSRSEFKINMDHTSPGVTSTRKNIPRMKRPLSPVVLCVPRDSRPAIPCVGDSRKHRGFPVVRSGSSSPKSWGTRSYYHEEEAPPETCICFNGGEIIWASWKSGKHSGSHFMQPTSGSLLHDRLMAVSHHDQEHPDNVIPVRAAEPSCPSHKELVSIMHNLLHEEIDSFCKKVAGENLSRKPYINWAVTRVAKSLQVLWPRSRTSIFGSNATGLALPSSDVDLVVCLPPVRNLEPIKEAGILEGRNGIKETCLQHAARYLANQDWVKNDSLKTIENTAIPLIMLIAEVPHDIVRPPQGHDASDPKDSSLPNLSQPLPSRSQNAPSQFVRLDISFRSSTHTGLQTMELVRQLTEQFPASIPLALVLKQFLADRNLDRSYSGGLNSYCLVLLIIRFLQHEHHLNHSNSQNLGSLLMDFLYFFGNVFDPRQMHVSIQGSGIYLKRERGHSIDPIHIDDPLYPANNVGKNCFRIHQCIKAFADAYSTMDRQLTSLSASTDSKSHMPFRLLRMIIPGIECEYG